MSSPGLRRESRAGAALIWAGPILLTVLGTFGAIRDLSSGVPAPGEVIPTLVLALLFGYLGALITFRQAGNTIGWLLQVIALGIVLSGVVRADPASDSFLNWLALVSESWGGLSLIMFPLTLIAYLFPTGRFFTKRQAWVGWLGAIGSSASLLAALFVEEIGISFSATEDYWSMASPVGFLPTQVLDAVNGVWGLTCVVLAFGGVWSLIVRYRRSSALVRAQIRWMLWSALLLAIGFVLLVSVETGSNLAGMFVSFCFASVPVTITVAIMKYRLFEIDRIISRTISYALLVAILAGSVAVVATLVGTQFESPLIVAAVTLGVAAAFNPLRRRIQDLVDRRFNRVRYDQARLIDAFHNRLQGEVEADSEMLSEELLDAVVLALEPESIGVWVATGPLEQT